MNEEIETSPELTPLERAVLEAVLSEDNKSLAAFRKQIDSMVVSTRTPSGVGFMTKLAVPAALVVADQMKPDFPIIIATHPQLAGGGAEFILQLKDGKVNSIEAFCYEGMWPEDESLFEVGR